MCCSGILCTIDHVDVNIFSFHFAVDSTISNDEVDFHNYDSISAAFTALVSNVTDLLVKQGDFSKISLSCVAQIQTPTGAKLPPDVVEKINSCTNFDELFKSLAGTPYLSWIDIRLLETMVTASDIQSAKRLIYNYKNVIYNKKLLDVLPNMLNESVRNEYYTKLTIKLKIKSDDITVAVLIKYRKDLEEVIMDITNGILILDNIKEGCIEIQCYIPSNCAEVVYKNARKNCNEFHRFHLVHLEIHMKDYPIIFASGNE